MLGNAVCTSVVYWIARRMLRVHEGHDPDEERIDIAAYIRSLNARPLNKPWGPTNRDPKGTA
jgi:hypothetical protein